MRTGFIILVLFFVVFAPSLLTSIFSNLENWYFSPIFLSQARASSRLEQADRPARPAQGLRCDGTRLSGAFFSSLGTSSGSAVISK